MSDWGTFIQIMLLVGGSIGGLWVIVIGATRINAKYKYNNVQKKGCKKEFSDLKAKSDSHETFVVTAQIRFDAIEEKVDFLRTITINQTNKIIDLLGGKDV